MNINLTSGEVITLRFLINVRIIIRSRTSYLINFPQHFKLIIINLKFKNDDKNKYYWKMMRRRRSHIITKNQHNRSSLVENNDNDITPNRNLLHRRNDAPLTFNPKINRRRSITNRSSEVREVPSYNNNMNDIPKTGFALILDLDECCLHTFEQMDQMYQIGLDQPSLGDIRDSIYTLELEDDDRRGSFDIYKAWGLYRPGLGDFLDFASKYFETICVWSAGQTDYVDELVSNMFNDIDPPFTVYTRSDCLFMDHDDYSKPLQKMIDDPALKGRIRLDNTFFLDDREANFIFNPDNGVVIPRYEPRPIISEMRKKDNRLDQFINFLISPEVIDAEDVRDIDKSKIFNS